MGHAIDNVSVHIEEALKWVIGGNLKDNIMSSSVILVEFSLERQFNAFFVKVEW